jgi:putative transcriptional regulator
MYKTKLRFLMAEHKINSITELIQLTGVSREPLKKLYAEEKLETLKLEILARICDYFKCPLSDLIEYTPDKD